MEAEPKVVMRISKEISRKPTKAGSLPKEMEEEPKKGEIITIKLK
jgi:hypothetical protein